MRPEGSSEAASEAASSDASGEKLVVYTNSGTDGRSEYLIEKAKEAGFDIEVVALGASEVTERMIAEKNNPLCDVTFGLNNIEYEKLKANGLLQQWKPDWTDGVDQSLIDPEGYYYPITTTPLVLMGNADFSPMPEDWTDLVKDEYKGLYRCTVWEAELQRLYLPASSAVIRIRTVIWESLTRDGKSLPSSWVMRTTS